MDQEKAAEFVAAAGIFMIAADGVIEPDEKEMLELLVSNFTEHPDKYLYINNVEAHQKRTETICAYFANSDDYTKGVLLGLIMGLAMLDDVLHESERELLYILASLLRIPKDQVDLVINMMVK